MTRTARLPGLSRAMTRLAPISLFAIASMPALAQVSSADPGMLAFNSACGTCHTIRPDDNRLGPTLFGILGRTSGTAPRYRGYSFAMKAGSVVWDEQALGAFIADPDSVVPGHGMKPFAPVTDEASRSAIVGFIRACERCATTCPAPKKCSR